MTSGIGIGRIGNRAAALCLALACLSSPAAAAPAILVDAVTGDILAGEEPTRSWHPASLTKLMTAHLALMAVEDGKLRFDTPVVISARAASQPASRMGLSAGQALRLEDALRVMLVRSANDIAVAIAEVVGGSEAEFVKAMNEEADRLGMSGTVFVNANGLPDDRQVTNARDMAVLAMAIQRRHADHYDLFRTPFVTVNGKRLKNTNGLLGKYAGIDGMKTGYVCASGFNLVASATRGGRKMISVVLGAGSVAARSERTSLLLDYGFAGPAALGNLRSIRAEGPGKVSDARVERCSRRDSDEDDDGPATAAAPKPRPAVAQAKDPVPAPATSTSKPALAKAEPTQAARSTAPSTPSKPVNRF